MRCSFFSGLHNGTFSEFTTGLCTHGDYSILGAGADRTFIDGMGTGRVLMADAATTVAISGVTITHGNFTAGSFIGRAGAVLTHGSMTLTDVVLTANVGGDGGAIYSVGDLRMERCQVTGNTSNGQGAGINSSGYQLEQPRKSLTLIDSTVAQNLANGQGGGIYNANKTVTIIGSTISDNSASGAGGGIRNASNVGMRIVNTTIAGNDGFTGGGVYAVDGCASCEVIFENVTITQNHASNSGGGVGLFGRPATIGNSIVANNTSGSRPNCSSWGFTSMGHNVFGPLTGCDPTTGDTTGDQNNVADPQLGALALNGGLTATMAPLATSPALEHGSPAAPGSGDGACAALDQRQILRPLGESCDVGAVERSPALALATVAPTHAGSRGSAIVVIGGSGFAAGARVALRRAGHTDIVADGVVVDGGGSSLAASFALTGAEQGAWDVVVTNPDDASVALPAGFAVEEIREPDVFAYVIGRSAVRAGVPTRFSVRYGNTGNVEALMVPVTLVVPAAFAPTMRFEVARPPAQPGRPFGDYSEVPLAATTDVASDSASLNFLVPVIPAGFTGILEFTLTPPTSSPHGSEFSVDAWIGRPWFENGTPRADVLADAATAARAFAERAAGVSTTSALDPVLIAYERNALNLAVSSSRDVLVNGFGQTGRAYSAAWLAIDLAGYAAAQAAGAPLTVGAPGASSAPASASSPRRRTPPARRAPAESSRPVAPARTSRPRTRTMARRNRILRSRPPIAGRSGGIM